MNAQHINTFVIFDLETTGLPCYELNRTKIIELCLVATSREHILHANSEGILCPRVLHKINLCVNPCKMIQPVTTEITGLYNELLENEQSFNESLCDMLNGFLGRLAPPICLLAHNGMKFDFPILRAELAKCGRMLPDDILCADSYIGFKELLLKQPIPVNIQDNALGKAFVDTESNTTVARNHDVDPESKHLLDSIDGTVFQEKFSLELIIDDMIQKTEEKELSTISLEDGNGPELECRKHVQKLNETTPIRSKSPLGTAPGLPKKTERNPSSEVKPARKRLFPFEYKDNGPSPKSFKLVDLYEFLLKKPAKNSHRAECDVMHLLECVVASGPDFIQWSDINAIKFSVIRKLW